MKKIVSLVIGLILMTTLSKAADAKFSVLPSVGTAIGKNSRMSLVGTLHLRESHSPVGIETFIFAPWGAGTVLSIDALRTERLTVKLFDVGVFVPIVSKVSATNFDRNFDLVIGTGLTWETSENFNSYFTNLVFTLDWKVFLPDPRLFNKYGDFMRPVYRQALTESFIIFGVAWH